MPQSSEIYAESVRGMNERQKSNLRERAERRHRREGAFSPWAALAIAGGAVLAAGLVGRRYAPDFREAYEIQRVVDAILLSGRERRWVRVGEVG